MENCDLKEGKESTPVYVAGLNMIKSSLEEIRVLTCTLSLETNRLENLDSAIDTNLVQDIIMKSRDEKKGDKPKSNIEFQFEYLEREVGAIISDLNHSIRKIRKVV
jgi:hypothetical protein